MNETISVIIPTYNHGKYIQDAIDSVLAQTYNPVEIIVIDDGSTDDTRSRVEKYSSKVKYIYKQNQGLSAARNTGIANATGKYVAILDADDMWHPEKLELQALQMLSSENVGLVGCEDEFVAEDKKSTGRTEKKLHLLGQKKILHELLFSNAIGSGGSGALVKKDCFNSVGLFDENLRSAEDWDMWLRISRLYEVRFVDKPLVKIRVRADSMSAPLNAETMLKNELIVLSKFFSTCRHQTSLFTKNAAYSYRYFCAAWAFMKNGKIDDAHKYIIKSFMSNPAYFLMKKEFIGLFYRISFKI